MMKMSLSVLRLHQTSTLSRKRLKLEVCVFIAMSTPCHLTPNFHTFMPAQSARIQVSLCISSARAVNPTFGQHTQHAYFYQINQPVHINPPRLDHPKQECKCTELWKIFTLSHPLPQVTSHQSVRVLQVPGHQEEKIIVEVENCNILVLQKISLKK